MYALTILLIWSLAILSAFNASIWLEHGRDSVPHFLMFFANITLAMVLGGCAALATVKVLLM